MTYCEKCDNIPEIAPNEGTLFFWPPVAHTAGKLLSAAKRLGVTVNKSPSATTISIPYSRPGLRKLIDILVQDLLPEERDSTKALIMKGSETPGIDDIARITDLGAIRAAIGADWLGDLLRENRLNSAFQPIFPIKELDQPYAHECLIRGMTATGTVIMPGQLFEAAQTSTLLFQLDRAARAANVRNAKAAGVPGNLFINFAPSTIYDPDYCLRSTIEVVEQSGFKRENIVFEVVETEKVRSTAHLNAILQSYRASGFRVALDDVGSGYSTLNMLPELRPDIIKIDRNLVDHVDQDNYKQAIVSKLIALADELNILVVAEGIERPEELDFLATHDVDYVQGFLLGRPSEHPYGTAPTSAG